MRKILTLALAACFLLPTVSLAADAALEKKVQELWEEIDYLNDRLDKAEMHAATDRITFTGDFRNTVDSLHYKNVTFNPGILVDFDDFGQKAMSGAFGGFNNQGMPEEGTPLANMLAANPDLAQAFGMGMLQGVGGYPFAAGPETGDIDNDVLFTSRLRLGMKAKVWDNVSFIGRLSMYKNWGDSTGSKVFDSWDSFTMDGTNGGNTTGDWLRVERAFFNWKDIGGSGFWFSVGRRPSTYGPPTQYRENEMRGGSPGGHLVHFNFDGITIGYNLENLTGIEGQTLRFCYGQGFESEWGNGELFNEINTDDTHLGGFLLDAVEDGTNLLQLLLFTAQDVTDGFKGVMAFPTQYAKFFAPTMYQDMQNFPTFNFVTRVQPSTNIGDIHLGGATFAREEDNGINWFLSGAWTQARPNGNAGMFGGLLSDPVFEAELNEEGTAIVMKPAHTVSDDNENGYSFYAGIQVPAPMGKLGLEYNYGSQYWTPFTQAADDAIGSKIATRGHVGEAYYIVDVNPNMFIKLGGLYYDYEYTNSGSPVGTPHKVDDVIDGKEFSMLPVIDTAWDAYASITVKF
ncbi:MAG: DUF3373 domain-containing protein [Desulfuromonas sp.]|nr:MAG: DUF3373 domain-containing protein [Desulfuromonas sp.]